MSSTSRREKGEQTQIRRPSVEKPSKLRATTKVSARTAGNAPPAQTTLKKGEWVPVGTAAASVAGREGKMLGLLPKSQILRQRKRNSPQRAPKPEPANVQLAELSRTKGSTKSVVRQRSGGVSRSKKVSRTAHFAKANPLSGSQKPRTRKLLNPSGPVSPRNRSEIKTKRTKKGGRLAPLPVSVPHRVRYAFRSRTVPPSSKLSDIRNLLDSDSAGAPGFRRIRVCLLDPGLQIGGAEWFASLLMKYANPEMFEFRVICFRPEKHGLNAYIEAMGIKVLSAVAVFGNTLTYQQWIEEKVFTMLESSNPDIIFFTSHYLYAALSAERLRLYHLVVRISNFDPHYLSGIDFSPVKQLICCSEEQHAHLQKAYPDKAVLIKTGVDLDQFQPLEANAKAALKAQLGLPDKRIVLFCGRLGAPLKRTWLFQKVVDELNAMRSDVAFLVVGYFERHRKSGEAEFAEFATSRGLIWKNTVPPWEAPRYFQTADILLSTSDKDEGLSNTVLQGMATGLVPVITGASGMAELIRNRESGLLLDRDDPECIAKALTEVLELGFEHGSTLGRNARQRAETLFNLRDSVAAYERAFYETYIASPVSVAMIDGRLETGGAEWLAALLSLNCDPAVLRCHFLLHRDGGPLTKWLRDRGISATGSPQDLNYSQWRESWLSKAFRKLRPHVAMPCTSTTWAYSKGSHRLLGISQNVADGQVLSEEHYQSAAHIIAVSQDVASVLATDYQYKTSVLRNSIDVSMFLRKEADRAETRKRLGCGQDQRTVLWCGRLSEHRKRLDVLCEVIERCTHCTNIFFVVLGYFGSDDPRRIDWEKFVSDHANLVWIQDVRHWEAPAYYSAADVYLSTSGYKEADFEGLSLATVQALAAGLPIVSTDSGGQKEIVTEGVNGYLTPRGDARLLSERLKEICQASDAEIASYARHNITKARTFFDIRQYARRFETICWALKNTIGGALPYNPTVHTELRDFADADHITPAQRHQASFFVNHICPLLVESENRLLSGSEQNGDFSRGDTLSVYSELTCHFTYAELGLLKCLASNAIGPLLQLGISNYSTSEFLARYSSNDLYAQPLTSAIYLVDPTPSEQQPTEPARGDPDRNHADLMAVSKKARSQETVPDRIHKISLEQLRQQQTCAFGLVIVDPHGVRAEFKELLHLSERLLKPGGKLALISFAECGRARCPDGRKSQALPICALMDYQAVHFPKWRQVYQRGSVIVLTKS